VTKAYVDGGKMYAGTSDGPHPIVYVLDIENGQILLEGDFEHRYTGMGFEPSSVRPLGDSRLVVGMRQTIVCLSLE
jgi:hypothetical protein